VSHGPYNGEQKIRCKQICYDLAYFIIQEKSIQGLLTAVYIHTFAKILLANLQTITGHVINFYFGTEKKWSVKVITEKSSE
jgi:hypothetical protein